MPEKSSPRLLFWRGDSDWIRTTSSVRIIFCAFLSDDCITSVPFWVTCRDQTTRTYFPSLLVGLECAQRAFGLKDARRSDRYIQLVFRHRAGKFQVAETCQLDQHPAAVAPTIEITLPQDLDPVTIDTESFNSAGLFLLYCKFSFLFRLAGGISH